jgi:hypothetical protein
MFSESDYAGNCRCDVVSCDADQYVTVTASLHIVHVSGCDFMIRYCEHSAITYNCTTQSNNLSNNLPNRKWTGIKSATKTPTIKCPFTIPCAANEYQRDEEHRAVQLSHVGTTVK